MHRVVGSIRWLGARVQATALLKQEEGASLVEYGLLVGLIAVVCIGAITLLGQDISTSLGNGGGAWDVSRQLLSGAVPLLLPARFP